MALADLNVYGDGTLRGGVPYVCEDYNYADSSVTGYEGVKFTLSNVSGYESAFGYDEAFDWLFLPSECVNADSNYPIGDYSYTTNDLNSYRKVSNGARFGTSTFGGIYYYNTSEGVNVHGIGGGARLIYAL